LTYKTSTEHYEIQESNSKLPFHPAHQAWCKLLLQKNTTC
jgi:hypothetical protein